MRFCNVFQNLNIYNLIDTKLFPTNYEPLKFQDKKPFWIWLRIHSRVPIPNWDLYSHQCKVQTPFLEYSVIFIVQWIKLLMKKFMNYVNASFSKKGNKALSIMLSIICPLTLINVGISNRWMFLKWIHWL